MTYTNRSTAWYLFINRGDMKKFEATLKLLTVRELMWMLDEAGIFYAESGARDDGAVEAWEEYELALNHALEDPQLAQ
jgi:hypothetical protein